MARTRRRGDDPPQRPAHGGPRSGGVERPRLRPRRRPDGERPPRHHRHPDSLRERPSPAGAVLMLIPLEWLAEYVDLPASPEALAEQLTLAGLEVEEIRQS